MKETRPVICVTGHRPSKIYGYNLNNKNWLELKELFKNFLKEKNCKEAITGMALGTDTVFALAVLELKQEGFDIKLHCAIPCKDHSRLWPKESVERYNDIIDKADTVNIITNKTYVPYCMQIRNEYMVNMSNEVLGVWDGNNGGTEKCIKYAIKKGRRVTVIEPFNLKEIPQIIKQEGFKNG